ncbi:hypothetical protein AYL99_09811 [Fonsecaea erecta]|uniref:Uncharacterized protein n=1 Tax=Fonsecaea erecta TaxID=1367422 RepID=A0A178Z7A7_9EURO|nr:hypothetical protein AYL99_09811 [Fonsecaea erecta]OAP55659.1 hypothetical protein AYL99_09811 [Fonsecaea erecta]
MPQSNNNIHYHRSLLNGSITTFYSVCFQRLRTGKMEDALFDALTPIHSIPRIPALLFTLMRPPDSRPHETQQQLLSRHASAFRAHLDKDRPQDANNEEKEKMGRLNLCSWRLLQEVVVAEEDDPSGHKRRRRGEGVNKGENDEDQDLLGGLSVSLTYEKVTSYFVIYTRFPTSYAVGRRRTTTATEQSAILCSKSSPGDLKSFIDYLCENFDIPSIPPLELNGNFMEATLDDYLFSLLQSFTRDGTSKVALLKDKFKSILDTIELALAIRLPTSQIAWTRICCPASDFPSWYYKMATLAQQQGSWPRDTFLSSMLRDGSGQTGVNLQAWSMDGEDPFGKDSSNAPRGGDEKDAQQDPVRREEQPVMRLEKLANSAYTLYKSGVKFKSQAVRAAGDAVQAGTTEGPPRGESANCVVRANRNLLMSLISHAHALQ